MEHYNSVCYDRVFGELQGDEASLASLLRLVRDSAESSAVTSLDLETLYIEDRDWRTALKIVQPSAKR